MLQRRGLEHSILWEGSNVFFKQAFSKIVIILNRDVSIVENNNDIPIFLILWFKDDPVGLNFPKTLPNYFEFLKFWIFDGLKKVRYFNSLHIENIYRIHKIYKNPHFSVKNTVIATIEGFHHFNPHEYH